MNRKFFMTVVSVIVCYIPVFAQSYTENDFGTSFTSMYSDVIEERGVVNESIQADGVYIPKSIVKDGVQFDFYHWYFDNDEKLCQIVYTKSAFPIAELDNIVNMLTSHYTVVRREEGEMSWEPDITYYMKQKDGNQFECKLEVTKIAETTNCTLTLGFAPKYNNPHVFTPPTIIIDE